MRRLLPILLLLILSSGCNLNAKYVEADRSTYEFFSSRIRRVVIHDQQRPADERVFDDEEIEDIELKFMTWDLRLRRAERFLGLDTTPDDPIWGGK